MTTPLLTAYEAAQVERIAAWKARRPGVIPRTLEAIKRPFDRLFEHIIPPFHAMKMLARADQAANWNLGLDLIERVAAVDDIAVLRAGPLERCDRLVKKVEDISREIITTESLLAGVGGLATELLDLPAEIMLALRTVHRVAGCYGYALDRPQDRILVLAVIGLSLQGDPQVRARTAALIRLLEKDTIQSADQARLEAVLESKAKADVEDDVVEQIASSLLENKIEEGIPFLGEIAGIFIDNAFINRIEEAAQCTFQERWLRDQGKVGIIAPAQGSPLAGASLGAGLTQAVYSTSYAVSFGVIFPAALVAQAGTAVLPSSAVDGLKAGAESAARDAERLIRHLPTGGPSLQ
jgi:hypothetical protein